MSTTAAATAPPRSSALNVSLWVAQLMLAVMFGMGGAMKLMQPVDTLIQAVPWAADVPLALVRFIGASELAAAIGLLLPAITRIKPGLTPLAAAGLAIIMLLAFGFHAMRGEYAAFPINLGLGALAVFVAWGRTRRAPITPRSR
jgi:putative oxidoreductase